MTDLLDPIIINFIYIIIGGLLTLLFMRLGCRVLTHIVTFDIQAELKNGNIAVGLMISGMFIGVGVALGLVIGLGLN